MRTLKDIKEGFHNTAGTGIDSLKDDIVKRCAEVGIPEQYIKVNDDLSVDIVKCKGTINIKTHGTSNEYSLGFKFNKVSCKTICLSYCLHLEDLEELPREIDYLVLADCGFESLTGCPKINKDLLVNGCDWLKDTKGVTYVGGIMCLKNCEALTKVILPKNKPSSLTIYNCRSLKSIPIKGFTVIKAY